MKNKNVKSWYIIGVLSLTIIGIIFLALSEIITNNIIKNIVNEIGSAIIISGILGIIDKYILQDSLVELILGKMKIKEGVDKTGLEEIVPGIAEINYKYYFKNAHKNIDIVHIYARTWTNNNIDEIRERLLRSNCKVRVVLVDPDSKFVPALENHFKYPDGQLKSMINEVSNLWKDLYNKNQQEKRSRKSTQGQLELYYHCGQPTNSMYRIDDRIVVVQTKSTEEKTTRMPAIIFKDTNKQECFYNIYLKEIEQLIKESRCVDFNDI